VQKEGKTFNGQLASGDLFWGSKSSAASVLPKEEKEVMLDKDVGRKRVGDDKEPVPTRSASQDPL
jgi:hypothetical protein